MIHVTKFDECCYRVSITEGGKEIESGIWCPVSKILAINGDHAGYFESKDDLIENLGHVQYTTYGRKST